MTDGRRGDGAVIVISGRVVEVLVIELTGDNSGDAAMRMGDGELEGLVSRYWRNPSVICEMGDWARRGQGSRRTRLRKVAPQSSSLAMSSLSRNDDAIRFAPLLCDHHQRGRVCQQLFAVVVLVIR